MAISPTEAQIEYMKAHIHESQARFLHATVGAFITAATIAVILRVMARRQSAAGLGSDDYMLFVTYFFYLGLSAAVLVGIHYGIGKHILAVESAKNFYIAELADFCGYFVTMTCVKCTILLFYRRAFPNRWLRLSLFGVFVTQIAWCVSSVLTSIFSCYPISKNWDLSIPGVCVDFGVFVLISGSVNVLLDFALLGLPMPLLWGLQMPTRKKVQLTVVFTIGCSACIVSMVRMKYSKQVNTTYDPSWDLTAPAVVSLAELFTGIAACCAISLRPLVDKKFVRRFGLREGSIPIVRPRGTDIREPKSAWFRIQDRRHIEASFQIRDEETITANVEHVETGTSCPETVVNSSE